MATSPQTCEARSGLGQRTHPLSDLQPGSCAVITSVSERATTATVQARLDRRLQDLGLRPGRVIQALRRAPLGDPVVFLVADYELCLRRRDVAHVQVTAVTTATTAGEPAEPGEEAS
ncbi:FeoA family protein [Actinomyces wuliandei]|uniref:FeoA family protein n=1 Tax=Actinomyces wuliandei TaxID=2057743 RepID=UPI001FAADD48|nr:FeoA family protein [Actinomyces wuliandei]